MYLALLLLLAFSAFFSASETALSSVNRIRMKNKADDGDKKAQRVLGLSDDYDRTLSAILIGNNVVNLTASSIDRAGNGRGRSDTARHAGRTRPVHLAGPGQHPASLGRL